MLTSNTAQLSNGVQLFYTDSGSVANSSDYTTVIFVHGTGINGHVFEILHRVAASRNLRTISVNRRDYPGSTPFTDQDLVDVKNGKQGSIDSYAVLMVDFICYVADNLQIPPASVDHSSGGIALVGWSHGGAVALWTLSNPEVVSCPQIATLEKFLKTVIMYDSAVQSLGFPVPKAEPVGDEPKSTEEYFQKLPLWLTCYFDHPVDWNGDVNLLDRRFTSGKATWNILSEEEKASFATWQAMNRFELPM
ncbi:hypothetical protein CPB83DRAFT_762488 [Crepidotus variabilis]|uniref:AB hydrolase-1 domain-containing protein n=1 Tax=Crepidotus variabilis TaxID=179855 RepID=A0A9P6EKI2_9AGAR|nr:hypothetical protein CPB83DRAFT_762488 [Crepidotus variabilis]